jgi:hypothetical protein
LEIQEKKFKTYFELDIRKKKGPAATAEVILSHFDKMFLMYKDKLFTGVGTAAEHPFYQLVSTKFRTQPSGPLTNIDEILLHYLQDTKDKTNSEYYSFIVKFIVLFREYMNMIKRDENIAEGNNDDYTQCHNAEMVPDFCNDFIVDYMEPEDYFDLDANELIEELQHLCYWMYVNGYTTSRLTLI